MNNDAIVYIKNKLLEEIEILKPYISEMKYNLYKTIIDKYDSLEGIRDIADLDLEIECIQYIIDINEELKYNDTSIDELEEIITGNKKTSNIQVIRPKASYNSDIITEEEISSIADDINNSDMLKIISHLINQRVKEQESQPTFTEEMDDMALDNLIDDIEIDDEYIDEDEEDSKSSEESLDDKLDDILNEELEYEEIDEDSSDSDLDSELDELFVEEDIDEEIEEDEDTNSDDDLDSALDAMFIEEEEIEEEDEDANSEDDLDSALDAMFIEEEEMIDEDSENEQEYDLDSALDAMFVDEEEEVEDIEEDTGKDLDSMLDEALDDEFDIDESSLGLDEDYEPDTNRDLSADVKKENSSISKNQIQKIDKRQDRIFVDGTARGNETQQMFNLIIGMYNKIPNIGKVASTRWKEYNEKRSSHKTASRVHREVKRA